MSNKEVEMTQQCTLSVAAEQPVPCPERECVFWQTGGDDLESGCAIERLQLHQHGPDVAEFLLSLRQRLQTSPPHN